MVTITTRYKSNASGRGQIVAKGGGKQRTVNYDDARSDEANHGQAAGTLALALFGPAGDRDITTTKTVTDTGYRFTVDITT